MKKVQTIKKQYATVQEARIAAKESRQVMAKLSLLGYEDYQRSYEKCGAVSFDDKGFYVLTTVVPSEIKIGVVVGVNPFNNNEEIIFESREIA